jgi:hypothetical protein
MPDRVSVMNGTEERDDTELDGAKYYDSKLVITPRTMHSEVEASDLEPLLLELVKIRASQSFNDVAPRHAHEKTLARWAKPNSTSMRSTRGEKRHSSHHAKRAALGWCEASPVWRRRTHLTIWNRLGIACRPVVGTYQPRRTPGAREGVTCG